MLPNLSYVYEEKIPRRPLTTLIGLNYEEVHLLAELGDRAKSSAPFLGKVLADRIQEFSNLNAGYPMSNADTQLYLQDWFLQLFQCREEKYLGFQEYFLCIPLNLVLTGIDVILAYGHEVTQNSLDPERAARAFQKSLALKIAREQLQSQAEEANHFYEMMLLD
jgi:hypothetical protein